MFPSALRRTLPALILMAVSVHGCGPRPTGPPEGPNVLLLVVDTLRPDAIATYGGHPAVAPTLDSLAATGIVFDDLFSQAPWTRPAMAALLSSRYPSEVGIDDGGTLYVMQGLPETVPYLPEVFSEAGYAVRAVQCNPNLKVWTGFARGFDTYDFIAESERTEFRSRAEAVLDSLCAGERPFFYYLHVMEPHLPYLNHPDLPPPELPAPPSTGYRPDVIWRDVLASPNLSNELKDHIRRTYLRDVRFGDVWLGKFFARLRAAGQGDRTLVCVISDHGEEHWEHGGVEHGHTLHREVLQIPGILVLPRENPGAAPPRRVSSTSRLTDIGPTLLELAGLPPLAGQRGRSLLPLLEDPGLHWDLEPTLAEGMLYGEQERALITPGWKLIRDLSTGEESLYDLTQDPQENVNLLAGPEAPAIWPTLRATLDSLVETAQPPADSVLVPMDEKTRRELKSLGYLGT